MKMEIVLTKELEGYVKAKVRSGRYADESEVVREALRDQEQRDGWESPALEAALLEGVRSPHRPYTKATLDRIRKNARAEQPGVLLPASFPRLTRPASHELSRAV